MRIWFQVVSSKRAVPDFIAELQRQCDEVVAPGTEVVIHGTDRGALGDPYAILGDLSAHEILKGMLERYSEGGYDVIAVANSLDPAVDALRELSNVPVLSLMQVSTSLALMLGGSFGVVVPNEHFIPRFEDLIAGYNLTEKLAGIAPMSVLNYLPDINGMFTDSSRAHACLEDWESCAEDLSRRGAEVIVTPGPMGCVVASRGIEEVSGSRVLASYACLAKMAEALAVLAQSYGVTTSRRRRYRQPPTPVLQTIIQSLQIDDGQRVRGDPTSRPSSGQERWP